MLFLQLRIQRRGAPTGRSCGGDHHRVLVDGMRHHYLEAGSGEPVVLLHGFPETSHAWRKVTPALAGRYHVIAPDLRGCGDTDRPSGGYDKQTVAADLHALAGHLGLGPFNLVSHDVGMMVGYACAATYPAQVRRLVLMEAALPGLGLEELYDAARYPRMYHLPLFEAPNGLAEALITGREKMFMSHFMRQQATTPSAQARPHSTSTPGGPVAADRARVPAITQVPPGPASSPARAAARD